MYVSNKTVANIELWLENITNTYIPRGFAKSLRKQLIYPRYLLQLMASWNGFQVYGERYPNNILFIVGIPKSGTTWLEEMLATYPGFQSVMIPEMLKYEMSEGGSHNFELPKYIFDRFNKKLVVLKTHSHGSTHNTSLLRNYDIRYVIMYRDLRDVAISYIHFVKQRPWHPEFSEYFHLSIQDGIKMFGEMKLHQYVHWIESWHNNRDPNISIVIRYEELISNPIKTFELVATHYGIEHTKEEISAIVKSYRFSSGPIKEDQRRQVHFRKGISGDWKNYFTPELKNLYKEKIGKFLIEFNYEKDFSW